jgi:hypothetical protein
MPSRGTRSSCSYRLPGSDDVELVSSLKHLRHRCQGPRQKTGARGSGHRGIHIPTSCTDPLVPGPRRCLHRAVIDGNTGPRSACQKRLETGGAEARKDPEILASPLVSVKTSRLPNTVVPFVAPSKPSVAAATRPPVQAAGFISLSNPNRTRSRSRFSTWGPLRIVSAS